MSNAEPVPQPAEDPDTEAEIIPVDFSPRAVDSSMEIEDRLLRDHLYDHNHEFVARMAQIHNVPTSVILNAAVESYKDMCEVVEAGGTIYVLGQDNNLHRIRSGEFDSPDAV